MWRVFVIGTLIALIAGLILNETRSQSVLEKAKEGKTSSVRSDDRDMEAAKRRARSTLQEFLALARDPKPGTSGFALKVGIPYNDMNFEYVWVNPFRSHGETFVGKVNNEPVNLKNIKYGQVIEFDESNIADWMYRQDGKMTGNHTACALLKRDTPAQREAFKREYGLECE
jgi:uncharacterized protein YegJ (DUF2314 family)